MKGKKSVRIERKCADCQENQSYRKRSAFNKYVAKHKTYICKKCRKKN